MKKPSRHSRQHDELQTSRSDMKKAAEKYARDFVPCDEHPHEDRMIYASRKSGFLAGVEWQKEQAKP